MKKGDKILIVIVLVIAALLAVYFAFPKLALKDGKKAAAGKVTVMVDREVYGVYGLDEDQKVTVNTDGGTNTFEIKDGKVSMIEADCPDKICVETKPVHHVHDTIVCLPHKVVLEITEGSARESDALDG